MGRQTLADRIQEYIDRVVAENPSLRHPKRSTTRRCPGCGSAVADRRDHDTGCRYWGATIGDIHE